MDPPPSSQSPNPDETTADHRYQSGDVIDGKYRLVRPLGEGGMGVVWVARHTVVDLNVAIKLIPLRPEIDRSALAGRLLQEVRAAVRVAHPSICRILDFGETHHGDPFVVSELLHGETLADMLSREPRMPAVQAVRTLLPIADGLTLAHARRIVHRDVKPENIFLARDVLGRMEPKLLDFGIAHFTDGDGPEIRETQLLGTPDYMSPEQARGAATDLRTDVWSLCVVLYRAITGHTPFAADESSAVLRHVLQQEPPATTASAAGDEALWLIIQRGLRKDPAARWGSTRELGEALARWLYEHGVREDVSGAALDATWLESSWEGSQPDYGKEFLSSELENTPVSGTSNIGLAPRPGSISTGSEPSPTSEPPPGHGTRSTVPAPPFGPGTKRLVLVCSAIIAFAVGLGFAVRWGGRGSTVSVPSAREGLAPSRDLCGNGSPDGGKTRWVSPQASSR